MNEDIVTMISREAKSKIICHKYMEEYFLKNGYVSAKKIHINLLYKLFSLKVLRKIRTFFNLLLRCKFYFEDSKHSESVIFDSEHTQCLEEILTNKNYIIVPCFFSCFDKIIINFSRTHNYFFYFLIFCKFYQIAFLKVSVIV